MKKLIWIATLIFAGGMFVQLPGYLSFVVGVGLIFAGIGVIARY